MPDAKVAHANHANLSALNRILQRPPARQARLLAPIRAMQEEQVHVAQPARLHGILDGTADRVIRGAVLHELRRVVNVLAAEVLAVLLPAREEARDGPPGLALVAVHLRRVEAAVARLQRPVHGLRGLATGHHEEAQLDLRNGHAIVELSFARGRSSVWRSKLVFSC